jgi:hypothetical protein
MNELSQSVIIKSLSILLEIIFSPMIKVEEVVEILNDG